MGAEQRKAVRRMISQPALMVREDGSIIGPCTLLDVSATGARLKTNPDVPPPPEFTLLLSKINNAMRRHCKVAWQDDKYIGVRFTDVATRAQRL
jgi:PilZ domain